MRFERLMSLKYVSSIAQRRTVFSDKETME